MHEWIRAVQKLLDFIDDHAKENPSLLNISYQVGYSPVYCSELFHRITGTTIKEYMAKRRLSLAALAIRDTNEPIVDIAIEYGFSSQQALTRAFQNAFGRAPAAYRRKPAPIPLTMKKFVLSPLNYSNKGDLIMKNFIAPSYRIEYIPEHKYLGAYKESETSAGKIYPCHDCDLLSGIVQSIKDSHPVVANHMAGWTWENGNRSYFYGTGVDADYKGDIPEGLELRGPFPGSYYLVFSHPPFDYLSENNRVMSAVEELAWNFDPTVVGYEWNEKACQDYQRHYPEVIGYQVLRPIIKI